MKIDDLPPVKESELQQAVARYLSGREKLFPFFFFHCPNGGTRNIGMARVLKSHGVKPGVPDICILLNNGKTLFIELKSKRGNGLSPEQKTLHERLSSLGHPIYTITAKHTPEAVTAVEDLLVKHMEESK